MNKKLLIVIILAIFIIGMTMGEITAKTYTVKKGKYKAKYTTKQLKNAKKHKNKFYKIKNTGAKIVKTKIYNNAKYQGTATSKVQAGIQYFDKNHVSISWYSASYGLITEKLVKC